MRVPRWLRWIAVEEPPTITDHQARMEQIRRELRDELLPAGSLDQGTPLYDDVVACAIARDGLAAEVEAWLATQAGRAL